MIHPAPSLVLHLGEPSRPFIPTTAGRLKAGMEWFGWTITRAGRHLRAERTIEGTAVVLTAPNAKALEAHIVRWCPPAPVAGLMLRRLAAAATYAADRLETLDDAEEATEADLEALTDLRVALAATKQVMP